MHEFVLELPNGLVISSDLKEADVLDIKDVEKLDIKTTYIWYDLPVVTVNDKNLAVRLCFFEGKFEFVQMALVNEKLYGARWNDWREEKERARARDTEKLLNELGYEVGKYDWGEIWAGYDEKGAHGSAAVRYFQ